MQRAVSAIRQRFVIFILFILFAVPPCFALETADADSLGPFRQGQEAIRAERYDDAAALFTRSRETLPVLDDYALLFAAEARHLAGRHQEALETLTALLSQHPSSPLRQKALRAQLRETEETGGGNLRALFDAYVDSYPDDEELLFRYAQFLKTSGEHAPSRSVFKKLYLQAGSRADDALRELRPEDLTGTDLRSRITRLMKQYEYATAEKELRRLLTRNDVERSDVMKDIAQALFRQKKYRDAAAAAAEAGDLYLKARSLYRAGESHRFNAALEELLGRRDDRAGLLLLAVAADYRRHRDFPAALATYEKALKLFPSERETMLWGTAWTHFMAGNYSQAAEILSRLHAEYNESQYLYWLARSREASGEDAAHLYATLMKQERSFYGFMARARTHSPLAKPDVQTAEPVTQGSAAPEKAERIEALIALDMRSDAATELSLMARRTLSDAETLYLLRACHRLDEFRRGIALVSRLPYTEQLHAFWYPLAFWETLSPIAERYGLDPFVALAVMREESRFDPWAKSPAGAYGLMQLMPETARRLDRSVGIGVRGSADLTSVRTNIHLGVYYLRNLLREFDNALPQALAAYNAGEQIVQFWLNRGQYRTSDVFIEDIPYPETRAYVKRVLSSYFQYRTTAPAAENRDDFAVLNGSSGTVDRQ